MQKNYRQMFEQELMKSQSQQDPQYQQLESQIMKPQSASSLAPTLGLVDHFTGSNFAAQAPKEESMKEKLSQLLQLRGQQQSQKLSGLGKLASMQGDAEARAQDQAYKKELMGLQMLNARAKMAKANGGLGGARKLGTEDIKAIDNIDMILGNLPKLKNALSKGQALKPSLMGYTVGGDNEATTSRRMVIEALGRLQSGGAIGNEEFKNFENLISAFQDDPTTRASKIENLMSEFGRRRNSLYYGPSAQAPSMEASAPVRAPSSGFEYSDDMSDEEVMAMGRMKGYL